MSFRWRMGLIPRIVLITFVLSWLIGFISERALPSTSGVALVGMLAFAGGVGICFIALVAWVTVAIINLHQKDRDGVYQISKDGRERYFVRSTGKTSGYIEVGKSSLSPRFPPRPPAPRFMEIADLPAALQKTGKDGGPQ